MLHHTDAGICCTQIDTDDGAIIGSRVVQGCLIFSICSADQGQRTDEDQEKVEKSCPLQCRGGSSARSTLEVAGRHFF